MTLRHLSCAARSYSRARHALARLADLNRDEQGTISIVSVFSMLLLAMLLGMVTNAGRQVDGKVKLQNAADAATYSGGQVLARGMNTLAFTNHLLCDIFAVTAFLREAHERNAEQMTPEILTAWGKIGPVLSKSGFPKFSALGDAMTQKVPLEQQLVRSYGDWASATADLILPLWEEILAQELVPRFQRALLVSTPRLAQIATNELARQHGLSSPDRGPMAGVLWRTSATPVGGDAEAFRRTLPAVDPVMDSAPGQAGYFNTALRQRNDLAHSYLNQWNDATLVAFDHEGKMSQFGALWRGFTCGQLDKLLNVDYPRGNLPMVIRSVQPDQSQYIDQDFSFVGVSYWPQLTETLPGLFKNPSGNDAMAFSEVMLFIPRQRLIRVWSGGGGGPVPVPGIPIGGVPGQGVDLPQQGQPQAPQPGGQAGAVDPPRWSVGRESKPTQWDLLNQSWTVKLIPAASAGVAAILQTTPPVTVTQNGNTRQVRVPAQGSFSQAEVEFLNNH